jgi:phosphoribosylanthranilate isomerase
MLPDDAATVAASGVDFIGLNFWPKSKRYVTPERAPIVAAERSGPAW